MNSFLHTQIIAPVKALLQQGLTPQALALSLATGFVLGFFPIFWVTTFFCVIVAGFLKLNQVAIQVANYCVYPLQFILFIPFIRLGELMFGLEQVSIDPAEVFELATRDFFLFLELYGTAISAACAVWMIIALPLIFILWKALSLILKRATS